MWQIQIIKIKGKWCNEKWCDIDPIFFLGYIINVDIYKEEIACVMAEDSVA